MAEQPRPEENGNGKTYEGIIRKVRGKDLYVELKEEVIISHPKGSHPVRALKIDYDTVAANHKDWAKEHPYDSLALRGDSVPIRHKTLYSIVDRHYIDETNSSNKKPSKPKKVKAPSQQTPSKSQEESIESIDGDLEKLLGNVEEPSK